MFESIILGIVQGLGEFLPISSSAHLIFVPWLFGWQDPGITFDVALHLGTLIAVITYFYRDWVILIRSGIKEGVNSFNGKLFWYLVIATVPGALIGKLFEEQAETVFRNMLLIGIVLVAMGILLYLADRYAKKSADLSGMNFPKSFLIGISQALAIVPGISRSGITMTTGLALGFNRETAAKFSFLLSTPIILGAGILKIKDITAQSVNLEFIAGVIMSAIVGFLSIKFLLKYLQKHGFGIFVIYRIVIGIILIIMYFARL